MSLCLVICAYDSEVLNSRAGLITETDALRQQNAELRMLLHQYVNSKVRHKGDGPTL